MAMAGGKCWGNLEDATAALGDNFHSKLEIMRQTTFGNRYDDEDDDATYWQMLCFV